MTRTARSGDAEVRPLSQRGMSVVRPAIAPDRGGPSSLVDVLDLETVEPTAFRAAARHGAWPRLFGGEVAAQAVVAAARTVTPDRILHSAHTYFLLPGDASLPVLYRVVVERDGGSYSSRSVAAYQEGRVIFTMTASFQRPRSGLSHQVPALDARAPEEVPEMAAMFADDSGTLRWAETITTRFPVEMRFPDGINGRRPGSPAPAERAWIRATEHLPADPVIHAAATMYFSDLLLLSSVVASHGAALDELIEGVATVNHTLWLHSVPRADEWFLYEVASDWAGGGRTLCRGRMLDREGLLFASTAQEGTIRIP